MATAMVRIANGLSARNNSRKFTVLLLYCVSWSTTRQSGLRDVSRSAGSRVMTSMDPDAFDEVYDAYRPRLFAFLLRLSRNRTLAEDLLDEVWLRLVRHADALRPDTQIGPWLFTVARNLSWTYRRDSLVEETSASELLSLWPSHT